MKKTYTHAIVVFFDPDYSTATIKEIGRTPVLPFMDALNVYAETPNPASQMIEWDENEPGSREKSEAAFNRVIVDPKWLADLFECI
jgi:hypothetical protein